MKTDLTSAQVSVLEYSITRYNDGRIHGYGLQPTTIRALHDKGYIERRADFAAHPGMIVKRDAAIERAREAIDDDWREAAAALSEASRLQEDIDRIYWFVTDKARELVKALDTKPASVL